VSRRRLLPAVLAAMVLAAVFVPPVLSGAVWTATSRSPTSVTADSPFNYAHLWSQSTDPAGLTGYAVRALSNPVAFAATGSDATLAIGAGGLKNGGTLDRVFTVETPATLPGGVAAVTVTLTPLPDLATGRMPVSSATLAAVGSAGGVASLALGAGAKRQANIVVAKMPGNGTMYTARIQVDVTWPAYSGTFLRYVIPVKVWDGNGQGPGPW
jgi:hypothetical protein